MPKVKTSSYALITGEDNFASQTAQNPATSRRLKSFISSEDGLLSRAWHDPFFSTQQLGKIAQLYCYERVLNGVVARFFFVVAEVTAGSGTYNLYKFNSVSGGWTIITGSVAPKVFTKIPVFVTINNVMQVSDGVNTYFFDGANWIVVGFAIPQGGPAINILGGGTLNASVGRNYWYTNAQEQNVASHESTSSPINANPSGALASKKIAVYQQPGLFSVVAAALTVTGTNSADNPGPIAPKLDSTMIGKIIFINGNFVGTIANVNPNTNLITLALAAPNTITNGRAVICETRSTHWHIYASESDGSKVGQYLASVSVGQDLNATPFIDQAPFTDNPANTFLPIFRPVRNDAPPPSLLAEIHKYRIWRRREANPTLFNFTANEEVASGANGNPAECVPGADINTQSDLVNENPYPDSSVAIRAFKSHGDALWMFTEKQGLPIFGQSIDDFSISQVTTFNEGAAGRFAVEATPHGLVFIAYGRKAYLYPTANYPWDYQPKDIKATDQLVEIGKPVRKKFEAIAFDSLDKVYTKYYRFGRRDWWVVCYPDITGSYHTYIFDFSTKGWFEWATGYTCVNVWEIGDGRQILVAGGVDGYVYVMDDLTGTYLNGRSLLGVVTSIPLSGPPGSCTIPAGNYYACLTGICGQQEKFSAELGPLTVTSSRPIVLHLDKIDLECTRWRVYFGLTSGALNQYYEVSADQFIADANTITASAPGVSGTPRMTIDFYPAATWRPALIDFGDPDVNHIPKSIDFELTSAAMKPDVSVVYYLDPPDADTPVAPKTLQFAPVLGANKYRAFFQGGNVCQRLLVEFRIQSSVNAGAFRGVKLEADAISSIIKGNH